MSLIINAHSIFMVLLLLYFSQEKLWVMFAKAKKCTKIISMNEWMNAWRNSIFDLIFYALSFTLNSFGLSKKIHCTSPLLVVFFLSTHDNVGAPQVEGSIIYSTLILRSKTLFFCFMAREENLWFKGNCTRKHMGR